MFGTDSDHPSRRRHIQMQDALHHNDPKTLLDHAEEFVTWRKDGARVGKVLASCAALS